MAAAEVAQLLARLVQQLDELLRLGRQVGAGSFARRQLFAQRGVVLQQLIEAAVEPFHALAQSA